MQFTLNQDQQKAADLFFDLLVDDHKKEMVLTSPPGCGKTYLTQYFQIEGIKQYNDLCKILNIIPKYSQYDIYTCATTNKAANVLGEAINKEIPTIHSLLGLKVMNDFETGTTRLEITNAWKVWTDTIFIIDECSMIDKELYDYIKKAAGKGCKIIYVGDKNQLVPVKSGISPVFTSNIPTVELTQIMRFGNIPALIDLEEQLRDTVKTGIFKPIQLVPGVIDLYDNQAMEASIRSTFINPDNESRIATYTNNRSIYNNSK